MAGMGEAKKRAEAADRRFHITKREQFELLFHVLNKPSADRHERRKRRHMWQELKLSDAVVQSIEVAPPPKPGEPPAPPKGLSPYEWRDNEEPIAVEISGPTMDFMIEQLGGQLVGAAGVVLGGLEDRLFALRDGGYQPPEGLFPPEDSAA